MPRINIRESDYTSGGDQSYSNFTVVVPGYVNKSAKGQLDDNGVFECNNRKEFEDNIGFCWEYIKAGKAPTLSQFGTAPVVANVAEITTPEDFETKRAELLQNGSDLYVRTKIQSGPDRCFNGYLRGYAIEGSGKNAAGYWCKYTQVSSFQEGVSYVSIRNDQKGSDAGVNHVTYETISTGLSTSAYAGHLYTFAEITDPQKQKDGQLVGEFDLGDGLKWYAFTDAGEAPAVTTPVVFIKSGDEGKNEEDVHTEQHFGNQIAYELINMGYTVLYKKINSIADLTDADWWAPLLDKVNYDFRYITLGMYKSIKDFNIYTAYNSASRVAVTRGDCCLLIDVDETGFEPQASSAKKVDAVKSFVNNLNFAETASETGDKYCAIFTPSVTYNMSLGKVHGQELYGGNTTFPASFHYLACANMAIKNNYPEWFAVAGFARGISKYSIKNVGAKFGEDAINILEPRTPIISESEDSAVNHAINVITNIKGTYYLWGNRTAYSISEKDLIASSFLNIRQLCTTLKKQLYTACRKFTFDPNSDILWINFCSTIRPTLEAMKSNQGIKDYKILKLVSENSRKAELNALVRIIPIEAIEDFDIEVSLEDSFGTVVATVNEA